MHSVLSREVESMSMLGKLPENVEAAWGRYCKTPLTCVLDRVGDRLGEWSYNRHTELPTGMFLSVKISGDSDLKIEIERTIDFVGCVVTHDGVILTPGQNGYGRILLRNSFSIYRQCGIKRVDVKAGLDIGPYVWARFGFAPTITSWKELREIIRKNLEECKMDIPEILYQDIIEDLKEEDPKTLWIIVDQAFEINGKKLGLLLLQQASWHGSFEVNDQSSSIRFNQYVEPEQ